MNPQVAITTGDPAGVGPELCVRLLLELADRPTDYRPLVIGDWDQVPRLHARRADLEAAAVRFGHSWSELAEHDGPAWLDPGHLDRPVEIGQISAAAGLASFEYVDAAIRQALAGAVDGVVTGPIHKQAWQRAGIDFPGHTELLVARTNVTRHAMMLTSPEVTCSLVTTHCGLCDVAGLLTTERILEVIELTHETLEAWHDHRPTIGVLGLNPHAGEGGRFGQGEEERIIQPAMELAAGAGIAVAGPLSPDTAFLAPRRRSTDAYVCMYHDQGLIPLKTLDFEHGVNVTLGLPIVRTSVDHGPAFDLAGSWKATTASLQAAWELAIRWCRGRQQRSRYLQPRKEP